MLQLNAEQLELLEADTSQSQRVRPPLDMIKLQQGSHID